jgi:hypothetical protein
LGMLVLVGQMAWGATCCSSGPPVDPGALAPQEKLGVGVGLMAGGVPTHWTAGGELHAHGEGEVGMALAARVRATRWLQGGLLLPAAVQLGEEGAHAGLSDALMLVRAETRAVVTGRLRPALVVGASAPLGAHDHGEEHHEEEHHEGEASGWRAIVSPALELSGERAQASAYGSLSWPVWTAGEAHERPVAWELAGSAGPRGPQGSLSLGLGLRGLGDSLSPLLRLGAQRPLAEHTRVSLNAETAPALPCLGRSSEVTLAMGASLLRTW